MRKAATPIGIEESLSEEKQRMMVQITPNILKTFMLLSFITSFFSGIGIKYKYPLIFFDFSQPINKDSSKNYLLISNTIDVDEDSCLGHNYSTSILNNCPTKSKGGLGNKVINKIHKSKQKLASFKSDNQDLHICDTIDLHTSSFSSHQKRLANLRFYKVNNKSFVQPRRFFSNGVMQRSSRGEEVYYETLVHPGMFTHESPKNVAIIGGGGATLREVLKHNTVERVVMSDVDHVQVKVSHENLKPSNDCSDIFNSSYSCFDDPRVEMVDGNVVEKIFVNSSYDESALKFDVLIVDTQDSQENEVLFNSSSWDRNFIEKMHNALDEEGIIIMQLGIAPNSRYPNKNIDDILASLEEVGMQSFHQYDNFHGGFNSQRFLVACNSLICRESWYANSAFKEVDIHERLRRTYAGKSSIMYMDGPSMASIQKPHKAFEIEYCSNDPTPIDCEVLLSHPTRPNIPVTLLETRQSSLGKNAGRGVFTKTNITKGSLIAFEKTPLSVRMEPYIMDIVDQHFKTLGEGSGSYSVYAYMYGYGFDTQFYGQDEESAVSYYVDGSMMTFVNHGCNATSNIIELYDNYYCSNPPCYDLDEQSLSNFEVTKYLNYVKPCSSPVSLRHIEIFTSLDTASRDINAGEEIFQNYLTYEKVHKELFNTATVLKSICAGCDTGEVTRYEEGKSIYTTK